MNKGLFIAGVIILIILLVVGILLIIFRNRISSTNTTAIMILGAVIIGISLLLFLFLVLSYTRTRVVQKVVSTTVVENAPVPSPEKIQFLTNKAVMISISPIEVPRAIEVPKPFEIRKVNTPECRISRPVIQQVPQAQFQVPMQSQVEFTKTDYTLSPVNIMPASMPETIVATI
jgi:hypothetical protein